MKPLDFVKTPKGNTAIITEVTGGCASIEFIGEPPIGSMSNPFGSGRSAGETHFPLTK